MANAVEPAPADIEGLTGPHPDEAARGVERTVRFLLRRSYAGNPLIRQREDDVVQEVLAAAVRQAGRIAQGGARLENPDAWLCRVTLNAARRTWRREGGWYNAETIDATGEPAAPPLSLENRLAIRQALARLDAACRRLLIERDVLGQTREAIAATLGITANALGVRLHRCRRKLLELVSGPAGALAH